MRSCNIIFNIYTENTFSYHQFSIMFPFLEGISVPIHSKSAIKKSQQVRLTLKVIPFLQKVVKKILLSTIKTENKLLRSSEHTKKGWLFWQTRSNQITLKNVVMCIIYARTKGQYLCIWCTCPCMQSFLKLEKIYTCF